MDSIKINYEVQEIIKNHVLMGCFDVDVVGLFLIRDCLLTQKFTGKSYTYRVFNVNSGENKYLFHRKNPIDEGSYQDLIATIKSLPFYNIKQFKTGCELIEYIFKYVFIKYGYTVREDQVGLSKHMFKVMQENNISLSDVAVGLGKTHAYIVACIANIIFTKKSIFTKKMPIIISTSSIELQKAIINDYLPEISKILVEDGLLSSALTCVLRKGKDHYLCEKRLTNYVETLDITTKRSSEYEALKTLIVTKTINLDEVKNISNYDKRKICVKNSNCFDCKKYRTCSYQKFMVQARKTHFDFQICNHNYFLADLLKRTKSMVSLLPDNRKVIIDEAHKLLGAAQQMYGVSLIQNELTSLIKKATPKYEISKSNKYCRRICIEVNKRIDRLYKTLLNQVIIENESDDTEKYKITFNKEIEMMLKRLMIDLKDLIKRIPYTDRKLLSDLSRIIEAIKSINKEEDICWLEKTNMKGQCVFVSIPKSLNETLENDLWQSYKSILLTSGTLAVDEDFSYMKKQLGLNRINQNRISEICKVSPFDFNSNCMIYISKGVPFPNTDDENYINKVSDEISKLIKASNGHALVLFTSYKPLRLVYNSLKEEFTDIPLIEMSRGRNEAVNKFRNSGNGVLFATGSMWEGVNIPGDILSQLIIVKLPFPIPDPISDYESRQYDDRNGFMQEVLLPKMLIKLRQGVGRLIRSEFDSGVVSILDSRASIYGKYHKSVMRALPECKIGILIEDINIFLKEKKEKSYFK